MIFLTRDFDDFLGDLSSEVLMHIYGPAGSGKTNLALIASTNASKEGQIVYIDSEGGFSTERLKQIAKDEFESVLKKVAITKPKNFDEQKIAVNDLERVVQEEKTSLVVVDTIGKLYRLQKEPEFRELGKMVAKLLRIARKYKIPVLMLNQVYTDLENSRITPVGTDIYEHFCDVIVELEITGDKRAAIIRKHPSRPEGSSIEFVITSDGVEEIKP